MSENWWALLQIEYTGQTRCFCYSTRQSRAHKIGVVQNTIHVLLKIFSGILLPKITEVGA